MNRIALMGTFDTKGLELTYIKNELLEKGNSIFTIDVGIFEHPYPVDYTRQKIAEASGNRIEDIARKKDLSFAMQAMCNGAGLTVPKLYSLNLFSGIIAIGGSGGTAIASAAMRNLPVGVPKLIVSTMASGNISQYVGSSDILIMPMITDICGINSISKRIFHNAASAISGMCCGLGRKEKDFIHTDKPVIVASMFGCTTPCIKKAKEYLEKEGYEVLVFHANGAGGRAMESYIKEKDIKGVLDITTTEWADEIAGGNLSAGKNRLEAAIAKKVPQVVSVGAVDMINFGVPESLPSRMKRRKRYYHNPEVTLIRSSCKENKQVAEAIADKLNQSAAGKTVLLIPRKGISSLDAENKNFYGPKEDDTLFKTLYSRIDQNHVMIRTLDCHINDPEFALDAARTLISLITAGR